MNFLQRLFNRQPKETTECPRCLGKGHVDMDDIKRLGRHLRWVPAKCAYCNGAGRVLVDIINKVAVDEAYLTVDLPRGERELLFAGDAGAIQRGENWKIEIEMLITNIRMLHFEQNYSAEAVADILIESYLTAPRRGR
jgi:hypothetical protein